MDTIDRLFKDPPLFQITLSLGEAQSLMDVIRMAEEAAAGNLENLELYMAVTGDDDLHLGKISHLWDRLDEITLPIIRERTTALKAHFAEIKKARLEEDDDYEL